MLIQREDLSTFCKILKTGKKNIVFTNGCFDILHAGHVRYLNTASTLGDILIVAVNSDESVRRLKGETRPINNEQDRAEVVGSLKSVDYVTIFSEQTADTLIKIIKPDIYVKGSDYTLETLPEAKIVQECGGRVEFVSLLEGHSTTGIINRINS